MGNASASILLHQVAVLGVLWLLLGCTHPLAFVLAFLYLYLVNDRYTQRLRRKVQFEERNNANQSRLLSDAESVRWLNHAIAKVWPVCMEQIASQQILLPIIPWFLDKYKPWTAKKAVVQHLYLGKDPPVFNKIRVLSQCADEDHLVLEMGMSFLSGDDMSATLGVQLRKGLGFGMWAKMHMTCLHVEGKVLVGVKFLQHWPFLGRVRMSFVEPPYFQMTVKPIFTHGIDVTELPGIAGWLDRLLSVAFQQTLVEPNMLVVDVEKFVTSPTESWFTMDEKPPVAYAKVEIIEGADMKPSDMNGLADPYVKGRHGNYRFRTKIQWKTLNPTWYETFKIPITSWEELNILVLEVRDKDHIFDDTLGNAELDISEMKVGQRYEKWLMLQNIKMGKLHLAVTILEAETMKVEEFDQDGEQDQSAANGAVKESLNKQESTSEVPVMPDQSKNADEYEPINVEGQEKTGIWVYRPGRDFSETWEPRKGSRVKQGDIDVEAEEAVCGGSDDDGSEESPDGKKSRMSKITKGLKKFGSVLRRSPREGSSSDTGGSIPPTPSSRKPINITATDSKLVWDATKVVFDEDEGKRMTETEAAAKGHREQAKKPIAKGLQTIKSVLSKKSPKGKEGDENGGRPGDSPASHSRPLLEDLSTGGGEKSSQNLRTLSGSNRIQTNLISPSNRETLSPASLAKGTAQQIVFASSTPSTEVVKQL